MAATQCLCNVAKTDFLRGLHQPTDVYMLALFNSSATLSKATTAYTTNTGTMPGEVTGTGYSQGGRAITGFTVALSGDTGYLDFTGEPAWTGATISGIEAALLYNATRSNAAIAVFTFTPTSVSSGSFVAQFPAAGATALIRIA